MLLVFKDANLQPHVLAPRGLFRVGTACKIVPNLSGKEVCFFLFACYSAIGRIAAGWLFKIVLEASDVYVFCVLSCFQGVQLVDKTNSCVARAAPFCLWDGAPLVLFLLAGSSLSASLPQGWLVVSGRPSK